MASIERGQGLDPTEVELVSCYVTGLLDSGELPPLPRRSGDANSVQAALEEATVPALRRPPCLVSFSGGRDSSLVLAAATSAARRHGLPEPIPATNRYPGIAATEERAWQEMVVRHLDLDDWIIVEIDGDLDLLGPVAREVLTTHGVLYPANVHTHVPLFREGRGGSLLTGWDGDGLFGGWRWRHDSQAPPTPRGVARRLFANSPGRVRRLIDERRSDLRIPWLREPVEQQVRRWWIEERSSEPWRWDRRIRWYRRRRFVQVTAESLRRLGLTYDVTVRHPFVEPGFLGALLLAGGGAGFPSRTATFDALFSDLLPAALIHRRTKARFFEAFWGDASRAFVRQWDGGGLDHDVVDPRALRDIWHTELPDSRTAPALQLAWLRSADDHR